jgi:hypothetical protein
MPSLASVTLPTTADREPVGAADGLAACGRPDSDAAGGGGGGGSSPPSPRSPNTTAAARTTTAISPALALITRSGVLSLPGGAGGGRP